MIHYVKKYYIEKTLLLLLILFILLPQYFIEIMKVSCELGISIYSIEIFPSPVGENDTIDVNVKIRAEKEMPDTRVLITLNAPGFMILIGNQSKRLDVLHWDGQNRIWYTTFNLKLVATMEGEYTVTIKLYILYNVSIPIEIDSRNVAIKVLGKAKLVVKVYDIIFHIPVDDAEVLAVSNEYPNSFVHLYRVAQGNTYEASLPKSLYNIVVNNQNVTKSLLLTEDKSITVEAFSKISITILILLAITSVILPFALMSSTHNDSWGWLGVLQGLVAFFVIIAALLLFVGGSLFLEPFYILAGFIESVAIDAFSFLCIIVIKIKKTLSYLQRHSYQEKKSNEVEERKKKRKKKLIKEIEKLIER